jgi:hypothetical protein
MPMPLANGLFQAADVLDVLMNGGAMPNGGAKAILARVVGVATQQGLDRFPWDHRCCR